MKYYDLRIYEYKTGHDEEHYCITMKCRDAEDSKEHTVSYYLYKDGRQEVDLDFGKNYYSFKVKNINR